MLQIKDILATKELPKTRVTYQWQSEALRIAKILEVPKNRMGAFFKFFKVNYESHPGAITSALSYCSDYEGYVPKYRLFYSKFYQNLK